MRANGLAAVFDSALGRRSETQAHRRSYLGLSIGDERI
jgi:hypothetical protein